VLTPHDGLYVTLDAYQIAIGNRIVLSGYLTGTPVQQYLSSVGIADVDGGAFFYNGVDTRTRGADLVAHYTLSFTRSALALSAGMNYNKTQLIGVAPNPAQDGLHGLVLPIIDTQETGFLTVGSPITKAFVVGNWDVGRWTVHAQLTRYGSWSDLSDNGAAYDQTYGVRYLLDASLAYHWSQWMLSVGGTDITNTYPQPVDGLNNDDGILPYPNSSPFGFSGAYYFGTVAYHW